MVLRGWMKNYIGDFVGCSGLLNLGTPPTVVRHQKATQGNAVKNTNFGRKLKLFLKILEVTSLGCRFGVGGVQCSYLIKETSRLRLPPPGL